MRPEPRDFVPAFLTGAILVVYWQVRGFDFISYDDLTYITNNEVVGNGLTLQGAVWAFTQFHAGNWHPLTWLSHMLDVQMFGLNPGAHHLVNVFLHILNALLLFAVLRNMTGCHWRSALVAALFALHPLHVESVAWVAERKDVLSTLFWMLAVLFYLRYTLRPSVIRYLPVFLAMALGLMSKPMLVTLPFVLLLLDYWPLGRFEAAAANEGPGGRQWRRLGVLLAEKLPLLALTAISATITFFAQKSGEAVSPIESFDALARVSNAIVSYATYIWKVLVPTGLAVFYPLSRELPFSTVMASAAVLVAVTAGVAWKGRRFPYLPVGWFWYLGTLVPVIGLVQVGAQAMADRYTYVPLIGLFIMVSWGGYDLFARSKRIEKWAIGSAAAVVVALGATAWVQVGYWKDTATLFTHAQSVTGSNEVTRANLAVARAQPRTAGDYHRYGLMFAERGRIEEAIAHYLLALEQEPDDATVHNDLGMAYARSGNTSEAITHFEAALALQPGYASARENLARIRAAPER